MSGSAHILGKSQITLPLALKALNGSFPHLVRVLSEAIKNDVVSETSCEVLAEPKVQCSLKEISILSADPLNSLDHSRHRGLAAELSPRARHREIIL
jgi:hypothetical protein